MTRLSTLLIFVCFSGCVSKPTSRTPSADENLVSCLSTDSTGGYAISVDLSSSPTPKGSITTQGWSQKAKFQGNINVGIVPELKLSTWVNEESCHASLKLDPNGISNSAGFDEPFIYIDVTGAKSYFVSRIGGMPRRLDCTIPQALKDLILACESAKTK